MMVASRFTARSWLAVYCSTSSTVLLDVLPCRGASAAWNRLRLCAGTVLRMSRTGLILLRDDEKREVEVRVQGPSVENVVLCGLGAAAAAESAKGGRRTSTMTTSNSRCAYGFQLGKGGALVKYPAPQETKQHWGVAKKTD